MTDMFSSHLARREKGKERRTYLDLRFERIKRKESIKIGAGVK